MNVTVTKVTAVEFPAGYLSKYKGESNDHVRWGQTYSMLVHAGRGPVYFADPWFITEGGSLTDSFLKAAVRRCFKRALELKPGESMNDDRTRIKIRRFLDHAIFEVKMPCGEEACIKKATLTRLLKELA